MNAELKILKISNRILTFLELVLIVFIQLILSGWGQEMKATFQPLTKHLFIIVIIIYDIPQNVDAILTLFTLMFASNISRQYRFYSCFFAIYKFCILHNTKISTTQTVDDFTANAELINGGKKYHGYELLRIIHHFPTSSEHLQIRMNA